MPKLSPAPAIVRDWEALAHRIGAAIAQEEPLQGKLIRIVRPG